jgi:hypothetical protein
LEKERAPTHGGDDGDHEVLAGLKGLLDLLAEVRVGDLDVVLGVAVRVHEVEEALNEVSGGWSGLKGGLRASRVEESTHVLDVKHLVLGTADVGDVHVVGRGGDVLHLLPGEDLFG